MENKKFLKDELLRRMLSKASLDKPSVDFTAAVMKRVDAEVFAKSEANQPILSAKYWLLIGLGFVGAAVVLFGLDWSFLNGLFGEVSIKSLEIPSMSFNIFDSLQKLFAGIQIPTIAIIGVITIISLIGLEKVLRKSLSIHIFMFI